MSKLVIIRTVQTKAEKIYQKGYKVMMWRTVKPKKNTKMIRYYLPIIYLPDCCKMVCNKYEVQENKNLAWCYWQNKISAIPSFAEIYSMSLVTRILTRLSYQRLNVSQIQKLSSSWTIFDCRLSPNNTISAM